MLHLKITNLYFKYNRTSQYLFENIHLTFEPTWSCIVGANGMGKSTLLKLISKKLLTEQGEIKGNELVHYCAQSTENIPPHFETFMHTYNKTTFRLKEQLGIHDDWLYRWDTLSHGERKRVQIAIALFINPDVLLLDEPTNHLDNTTKSIIFNALKSFTKIGLLVSHDRQLLDELCSHTFLIKDDEILSFKTNHSNAMHEYQKQQQHLYQTQLTQKKEFKKIKHSVQIQKQKVVKSQARLSKSTLDKRDSDLKNKINLAKLTGKDKKDGRVLKTLQSKKKQLLSKAIKTQKSYALGITLDSENAKSIFPVSIKANTLNLSDTKKLIFPSLSIQRKDKIGIVGDNGSGKSSFIHHLLSKHYFKGPILYIPQEITHEQSKVFFERINAFPQDKKGAIYTTVTQLGSNAKKLLQSSVPSPGEIRKLFIAKGLLEKPSMIILDEPTNHMDLDSIVALEKALQNYNGVLIIISHDTVFLHNICNITWQLAKTTDTVYELHRT